MEGAREGNNELWFVATLFIECKYFTREINFRVFDNDKNLSRNILCNQAYHLQLGNIFKENESHLINHHYLTATKIAKLYDYDKTKNNEDDVFKSTTQAIKSLIFFKEKKSENVRGSINYPIVVYSGIDGIFVMPENNTDDVYLDGLKKYKNIIFHLKYSYPQTVFSVPGFRYLTQDFYVDFIHKDELDNFLKNIEENEVNKIKLYFGEVRIRDILEKKYYSL